MKALHSTTWNWSTTFKDNIFYSTLALEVKSWKFHNCNYSNVIIWNENECWESCDNCDMFMWEKIRWLSIKVIDTKYILHTVAYAPAKGIKILSSQALLNSMASILVCSVNITCSPNLIFLSGKKSEWLVWFLTQKISFENQFQQFLTQLTQVTQT